VTGVDSVEKQDFLRSIGFDQVIDYTQEDFTTAGQSYDVILDAKTNRSPFAYARVLKPDGTYVSVGGAMPRLLQCLVCGPWIARSRRRQIRILALKPNTGLGDMTELAEAGHLVPSIDPIYTLDAVPHAINRFKDARHLGKIVARIGEPRPTH
jgi:NADPH:quinone reductase-like Zn-dependent oxidoreductase